MLSWHIICVFLLALPGALVDTGMFTPKLSPREADMSPHKQPVCSRHCGLLDYRDIKRPPSRTNGWPGCVTIPSLRFASA